MLGSSPVSRKPFKTAAKREIRSVANMVQVIVAAYCRANVHPLVAYPDAILRVAKLGLSPP